MISVDLICKSSTFYLYCIFYSGWCVDCSKFATILLDCGTRLRYARINTGCLRWRYMSIGCWITWKSLIAKTRQADCMAVTGEDLAGVNLASITP